MPELEEGDLKITYPSGVSVRKFDGHDHKLTHCMKAVDFIFELDDRYYFIEFKDPQNPKSKPKDRDKFITSFLSGKTDRELTLKYRDSFLYEWASGRANKKIYYYILMAFDKLTEPDLLARTDELKRILPSGDAAPGVWTKKLVHSCTVFNIETWNKFFPDYTVSRIT